MRNVSVFIFTVHIKYSVVSVSYTHLDVYKRQQFFCAKPSKGGPLRIPIFGQRIKQ